MRTYVNERNIGHMEFTVPATVFCPLGSDYCREMVTCELELGKKIVDFLDLDEYFKKSLDGKEFTTEELCDEVFRTLDKAYEPKHLRVMVLDDSCFPIKVAKEK